MVSHRLRNRPPTWIVVDNGALVEGETAPDRMDRDEIIEEILDTRGELLDRQPSPYSPSLVAKAIQGSEGSTSLTERSEPKLREDRPSGRLSVCSRRRRIAPLLTCLHITGSSKHSGLSEDDREEQQLDIQQCNSLSFPPSLEMVSSDEILSDLEKDPRMDPKFMLPDCLIFGVLVVRDATLGPINGVYHCTGTVDSVGHYTKAGRFKNRKVTFSIFRCQHADRSRRWYLSIVSKHFAPGTKHDTDLYAALATGKREEIPPADGWRVVVGSGIPGVAPMTMWIPHESRVQPCSVCFERPVSHVLVPCGHACLCRECAKAVSRREIRMCPEGRCRIDGAVRLYGTVVEEDTEQEESKPKTKLSFRKPKQSKCEYRRVVL